MQKSSAVVGGGLGGLATAILLARQGRQVTLFEKAAPGRDKICGDGCTPRTVWMLDKLGLGDLRHDAVASAPANSLYATSPSGIVRALFKTAGPSATLAAPIRRTGNRLASPMKPATNESAG